MITESELELALTLQKEIKDLRVFIAKIDDAKVSSVAGINSGIGIDGNRVEVDSYTKTLLQKFKDDVVHVHKVKLQDMEDRYSEIIESPGDALMRIVRENG